MASTLNTSIDAFPFSPRINKTISFAEIENHIQIGIKKKALAERDDKNAFFNLLFSF